METDWNGTVLDKWNLIKDAFRKKKADIKLFYVFQSKTKNGGHKMSSGLILTTNDEVFAVGYNNGDNLLALTREEFGKEVVLKEPEKIGWLSGKNIRKFVVSERFGAALTDHGRLIHWGVDLSFLQNESIDKKHVKLPHEPRVDLKIVDLACGAHSITFVTYDNQVHIWGYISLYHSQFYNFEKVPLPPNVRVKELAAGWSHVALLDTNGYVWTFGYGSVGQLGYDLRGDNYTAPKKVSLPIACKKVQCGVYSTLFLLKNGELYACGSNSQSDYLCVGRTGYVIVPAKVLLYDKIADIAATYGWYSGIYQSVFAAKSKDGLRYFKWGVEAESEIPKAADSAHSLLDVFANYKTPQSLGEVKSTDFIAIPSSKDSDKESEYSLPSKSVLDKWWIFNIPDEKLVTNVKSFTVYEGLGLSKSVLGAFIVTTDDDVYSWGFNGISQPLGYPSNIGYTETPAKVEVLSGKNVKKIVIAILVGGIALTTNGSLYVWGSKSLPQVEKNLVGKTVIDVTCARTFYVYLLENGEAYFVDTYHLGITNFSELVYVKIRVPKKEKIGCVESGIEHFLVLTDQYNVYTYGIGNGRYGALGDEWEKYDDSPLRRLKINSPGPCQKIMAGNTSSFFLTLTGDLYEMRYHYNISFLEFEDKREKVVYEPKKIPLGEKIEDIAGTALYGYALKTVSGKIFKWRNDENPEELQEAKHLVEAFEDTEVPQSLSLVRLSTYNERSGSENTVVNDFKDRRAYSEHSLFGDPLYSDVTILLKDGEIPGHKVLLHTKSAFFRNALSSSKIVNRNVLDLESYSPNAVRALMKFIYDLPIGRASSLEDTLNFRKLAVEDGNPDLIAVADSILLKNMTQTERCDSLFKSSECKDRGKVQSSIES